MAKIKGIILAAGFGTRLYPLTENKAKGLLPYNGQPLMTHIVNCIRQIKEIDEISIAVNNKFYKDYQSWHSSLPNNEGIFICSNNQSTYDARMGAPADLYHTIKMEHFENDDLLVTACDYFIEDLQPLYNFFKEKNCSVIALQDKIKGGQTILNLQNKIIAFKEKIVISNINSLPIYIFKKEDTDVLFEFINRVKNLHDKDAPGHFIQYLINNDYCDIFGYKGIKVFPIEEASETKKALEEMINNE